jgi:hypothetical protein
MHPIEIIDDLVELIPVFQKLSHTKFLHELNPIKFLFFPPFQRGRPPVTFHCVLLFAACVHRTDGNPSQALRASEIPPVGSLRKIAD